MLNLIYPEIDRIIRLPINVWENNLEDRYEEFKIKYKNRIQGWQDEFSSIINQTALVSLYLGDNITARNICSESIRYFYNHFHILKEKEYINCVFQPWINIGRLNRLEGTYEKAIKVFLSLNLKMSSDYLPIDIFYIDKNEIIDKKIILLLKNVYNYETAKTLIIMEKYDRCIEFINKSYKNILEKNVPEILIEASLISTVNINGAKKGLELSYSIFQNCSPNIKPIILLQMSRINIIKKNIYEAGEILKLLLNKYSRYINNQNYNGIRFYLEILYTATECLHPKFYLEFLKKVLEQFELICDEPCIIECYFLLKKISKIRKNEEKKLEKILINTKYFFIRNKYILDGKIKYNFNLSNKILSHLAGDNLC